MANIVASDVAYATVDQVVSAPGRTRRRVKVTFPATNQTYVAGGVPLVGPSLTGTARGIVAACKVIGATLTATASMNPVWQWNGSTTAPTLVALAESAAGTAGTAFDQWVQAAVTVNSQVLTLEVEGG